jgi:hypothetical protein
MQDQFVDSLSVSDAYRCHVVGWASGTRRYPLPCRVYGPSVISDLRAYHLRAQGSSPTAPGHERQRLAQCARRPLDRTPGDPQHGTHVPSRRSYG